MSEQNGVDVETKSCNGASCVCRDNTWVKLGEFQWNSPQQLIKPCVIRTLCVTLLIVGGKFAVLGEESEGKTGVAQETRSPAKPVAGASQPAMLAGLPARPGVARHGQGRG